MCTIVKVLEGKDAQFIINLFRMADKKAPKGNMLGHIDKGKDKKHDCPHMFCWGDELYCDNQGHLKIHLDKEGRKCEHRTKDDSGEEQNKNLFAL